MMNENSPICARLIPAWTDGAHAVAGEEGAERDADELADDDDAR